MIRKADDIKLNVRPVLLGMEHRYFYEGPCRFGKGEALQPGYDKFANEQLFEAFLTNIEAYKPENINILEPVRAGRTDDWENKEEMWELLRGSMADADVAFFFSNIGMDDIDVEFAQRFKTPLIVCPNSSFSPASINAAVTAKDPQAEVYVPMSWTEAGKLLASLRARKVIRSTNILLASRFNSDVSYSSVDTFSNHDLVTKNLGVHFRYINVHELLDQMTPATEEGNHTTPGRKTPNIDEADMTEVNALADELLEGADEVHVNREYLINSLIAYKVVQKNMELKDCNGFTIPCPDTCSTRRMNKMQFTFCLTHSLNMENGVPSACEFDADAVLSQQALIAVSGQRPYMGNTTPMPFENGAFMPLFGPTAEKLAELAKGDTSNLYFMQHSVPHRRFRDPAKTGPYALRHFAYDQGWGAVMRYNFDRDKDQVITLCRFSPDGGKLFIGKGTIVAGDGYELDNCNGLVYFRVADQKDFFTKQVKAGNHLALVYGDYTQELENLAKVLGIEALIA